jgi:osmotically inducible protein OsmC
MAEFSRHADVEWHGGLLDGRGSARAGTGAFSLPVTFPSRVGESGGQTSPEELIAAAHASCFAMAFNATLGRRGGKAERTQVKATITADKGEAGIKIVSSRLELTVSGLQGIDPGQLEDVARQAEGGCPVSNALRNNLTIDVIARVG